MFCGAGEQQETVAFQRAFEWQKGFSLRFGIPRFKPSSSSVGIHTARHRGGAVVAVVVLWDPWESEAGAVKEEEEEEKHHGNKTLICIERGILTKFLAWHMTPSFTTCERHASF